VRGSTFTGDTVVMTVGTQNFIENTYTFPDLLLTMLTPGDVISGVRLH
jgi:hypothetical protein